MGLTIDVPAPTPARSAPAALIAVAERTIRRGSKSFASASRLFDPATRAGVVLLYAWCRHCDDVVDGQSLGFGQTRQDGAPAVERVDALFDATARALAGHASGPAFEALAEVVRRHRIPHRFAYEHLSGFRLDAEGRRYTSFADTLDYCYHVAGVVGVMMALVMGVRDDATLDRAADLGIGFQLTNIARDIVDDHAAGRVYLPRRWLADEGLCEADLAVPARREALARVAARLVEAAEPYYESARIGLARPPLRSAWAVATAHGVYREIGLDVKARRAAAWDERVATKRSRKWRHAGSGAVTALGAMAGLFNASAGAGPVGRQGLYVRP